MQRSDIVFGIQLAIEKGEQIEQAKQTFIDAGYTLQDVEDSVKALVSGFITEYQQPQTQQLSTSAQPSLQSIPSQSQPQIPSKTQISNQSQTQPPIKQPQQLPNQQNASHLFQPIHQPQQLSNQQSQLPSNQLPPTFPIQQSQIRTQQIIPQIQKPLQFQKKKNSGVVFIVILTIILLLALGALLLTVLAPDWVVSILEKLGLM